MSAGDSRSSRRCRYRHRKSQAPSSQRKPLHSASNIHQPICTSLIAGFAQRPTEGTGQPSAPMTAKAVKRRRLTRICSKTAGLALFLTQAAGFQSRLRNKLDCLGRPPPAWWRAPPAEGRTRAAGHDRRSPTLARRRGLRVKNLREIGRQLTMPGCPSHSAHETLTPSIPPATNSARNQAFLPPPRRLPPHPPAITSAKSVRCTHRRRYHLAGQLRLVQLLAW